MKAGKRAVVILALALAGCQSSHLDIPPTASLVTLRLGCTPTTAPLVRELAQGYQREHPATRLVLDLAILTSGQPTVEDTGPPVTITEAFPREAGIWSAPLAHDHLAIIVHPENPLGNLTLDQLRAIYQGRITGWAALGGGNRPITATTRNVGSAPRQIFDRLVLGGLPATGAARLALSDAAMLALVRADPGAIGFVSLTAVDTSVRPIAVEGVNPTTPAAEGYPLRTTILAVAATPPEDAYLSFLAWVQSPAGQAIVAHHYTPLEP